MKELKKWGYRVQTVGSALKGAKDEEIEALLSEWGEESWEVIAIHALEGSNKVRIIAKRPLSRAAMRRRTWPA